MMVLIQLTDTIPTLVDIYRTLDDCMNHAAEINGVCMGLTEYLEMMDGIRNTEA
jgi:hypothetical protein